MIEHGSQMYQAFNNLYVSQDPNSIQKNKVIYIDKNLECHAFSQNVSAELIRNQGFEIKKFEASRQQSLLKQNSLTRTQTPRKASRRESTKIKRSGSRTYSVIAQDSALSRSLSLTVSKQKHNHAETDALLISRRIQTVCMHHFKPRISSLSELKLILFELYDTESQEVLYAIPILHYPVENNVVLQLQQLVECSSIRQG